MMDVAALLLEQAARLARDGLLSQADLVYRKLLADDPGHAAAHLGRATVLHRMARYGEAIAEYREALRHAPSHPAALSNLGAALGESGQSLAALAAFDDAIALAPDFALAHVNRAATLERLERDEEAAAAYREAIRHDPGNAEIHSDLGITLKKLARTAEAVQAHRQAVALAPDNPKYHSYLGMVLLLAGVMAEGWAEYEWRRKLPEFQRDLPKPAWTGEPLEGKTILLHAEQGYGDILHFVRYAPLVAATGGRVVLWVPDSLTRLLGTVPGVAEAVSIRPPASVFDVHLPLMSLPHAFGTDLDTIPANIPYLFAEPAATKAWGERLAALPGLKAGLVWAGRSQAADAYRFDRRRSLRLEQFAPLAEIDGITFVSLQTGDAAEQATAPPAGLRLVDWMDEVTDFADTAALVANLDLVISVDTSVVHLAGALGKPVWILSRFDGCWRWLENRDDSPWYPTARLFRQPAPGQWEPALLTVADALRRLVGE
ncbi:MAG: tetratricopeptide repeat protein [Magnetospirillum sp.]|nr:tetratricopeptide repeat protein [Magnetospirillum sp.]